MPDIIKQKDISEKNPALNLEKSLESAKKEAVKTIKTIENLLKINKKLIDQNKNPTNVKQVRALNDAIKDQEESVKDLVVVRKAELKADKAIEKARLAELKLQKDREKAFDKFEKQQQRNIKASEKERQAELKLASARENAFKKSDKISADKVKNAQRERIAQLRLASDREKAFKKADAAEQLAINKARKLRKSSADNANAFKKLTKQAGIAQARFQRLAAQYGITSKKALKARFVFDQLDARLRSINTAARNGRPDVGRYGLALGKVRGALTTGLGALGITAGIAGLARLVGGTIGIFSGFEKANSNLQAILGATDSDMNLLKTSAKELGSTTAFTASQVTELQTEFAKLGFNSQQIDDATESTLALAAAAGVELAEAAAVAGATLGGFGLDAAETGRVTDVMAKSFSTSALDMEKFKESMKSAAPAARAVGISVEKTTALLGTLANAGISGSKAGNNLKTSLINLNDAGLTLEEGLEKVANSENKLSEATKLVGKNAAASFLVLSEGVDTTERIEEGLNNAAGAAQRMAEIQLDNLAGDITILGSAWEGFVLSVESGEGAFNNFLRQSVQMITGLLGMLSGTKDLSDEFFDMKKETDNLESSITPLLNRYDELAEQTELTADEQKELDEIILKVAADVPSAISAFDKYGKALDISTTAARAFIEQQKRLLILKNAEAIAEQQQEIVKLGRRLERVGQLFKVQDGVLLKYNRTLDKATNGVQKFTKATDEEIRQYQDKNLLIQNEIDDRNAMIALLRGEQTELEKLAELEEKENEAKKVFIETIKTLQAAEAELTKQRDETAIQDTDRIARLNKEIEVIGAKIKALKDLQAAEEGFAFRSIDLMEIDFEKRDEFAKLKSQLLIKAEDESIAVFDSETKRLNDIIALEKKLQNEREQIQDARIQSARNVANVISTINSEDEETQKAIKEFKRALALFEIKVNLSRELSEIRASDDSEALKRSRTVQAITFAGANTAAVLTAFDGVDDTGGRGDEDSKGGKKWTLHPNEQVWSKQNVKDGGGRTRKEAIDILQNYDSGLLMSPHAFKNMELGNTISSQDINYKAIILSQDRNAASLEKTIKDNVPSYNMGWDKYGDAVESRKLNGVLRKTRHKSRRLG